jgi:hypothetical protein
MDNYMSVFVAVLQHLAHLTEEEAKTLDKELREMTIPGTYDEASRAVADILAKVKKPKKIAKVAPDTITSK